MMYQIIIKINITPNNDRWGINDYIEGWLGYN